MRVVRLQVKEVDKLRSVYQLKSIKDIPLIMALPNPHFETLSVD